MKSAPFSNYAGLPGEAFERLNEIVSNHRGLDDIFRWGGAQTPPIVPEDVVVQDEFTHDVIVPFRDGLYLVYGTT